jgi:hypothetical protein
MKNENRLIVEFMGFKPKMEIPDVYSYSDMPFFSIRENTPEKVVEGFIGYSKYHTSWDWLMPVVSKITQNEDFIGNEYRESILDTIPYGNIEDSYKVVIEFIKYYNTIK